MPVLYAGIAERRDERHVDLELLELAFDLRRRSHRSAVVGVSEELGELVRVLPQCLHLSGKIEQITFCVIIIGRMHCRQHNDVNCRQRDHDRQ